MRRDVADRNPYVAAHYRNVVETRLGTTIANDDGVKVATIEHLMAALWGCGVDNAMIEIDGPEIPIMDGSSEPFVFLIECAGVVEQLKPRKLVKVLKAVEARDGDAYVAIKPAQGYTVHLDIDFNSAVIGKQTLALDFSAAQFKNTVSRARTFGFEREVDTLRQMGLARGGSLENAIVVNEAGILNPEGLRYADEFVRHKVLDCVGDLFLAGARLIGEVHGFKSGHCLNNKLLRTLFADHANWQVVPAAPVAAAPVETPRYAAI
jgi:UDP-3-O-[3-hydroxymyristoyl] N-acetylglucosamine deacetylase